MNSDEKVTALAHTLSSAGWVNVIKPSLQAAIDTAINSLITGSRPAGDETSDDGLKNRVIAWRWVLEWERKLQTLVDQLDQAEQVRNLSEHPGPGGSPYDN